MLTNKLLASFVIALVLSLAGCGATDSGSASSKSATSSSTGTGGGSGGADTDILPEIIGQPESYAGYEGESVSFEVEAVGSNLGYQWQKAIDNAWIDLNNATDANLELPYLTLAETGLYRVEISNAAGVVVSEAVELSVKQQLSIISEPQGLVRNEGSSADFQVSVEGEGPYSYQWFHGSNALTDNSKYIGSNTYHLVVNALTSSDAGQYYVQVSNADNQVAVSAKAQLSVSGPAKITSNPVNITKLEGYSASLSVSAGGTAPIAYQWQKKVNGSWKNVSGANASVLNFSKLAAADAGEYRCMVNNSVNVPDVSGTAVVSVVSPVAITSQPTNEYGSQHRVAENVSVSYTVAASGSDVSYRWYKNGFVVSNSATLNLGSVDTSDSAKYTCRAYNSLTAKNCSAIELVVLSPVSISSHPSSVTAVVGESKTLSVAAQGTAPFAYQWQKSSGSGWSNISGATASQLSLNSVDASDAADYRVLVNNEVGQQAVSSAATVTVIEGVAITKQPSDTYGNQYNAVVGESVGFSVSATGTDVAYSWYKDGQKVSSNASLSFESLSTADAGVYQCRVVNSVGNAVCDSVELVVMVPPSIVSQSSSVSVFEGQAVSFNVAVSGSPMPSIAWLKNGQPMEGQNSASLDLGAVDLEDEASYSCIVSNAAASVACGAMSLDVKEVVRITSSPSNLVLTDGASATLAVVATGEPPLTYAWYKDGALISQGTSLSSIDLNSVTAVNEGNYQVIVSNAGSQESSSVAQITVMEPPVQTGSAYLAWSAPQRRVDGDQLDASEIKGYKVYMEMPDGSYEEVAYVLVSDGTSVEIRDLELGTYYFALTTIDVSGIESALSAPVEVDIR